MTLQFKKATKKELFLRMALIGPAGGGKTFTALKIATYIGGPIAVLDTERGSASKYAGEKLKDGERFEFDVLEPTDFSPQTYVEVIRAAEASGYKVLIIDSLSHAWMGKGGALEMVDAASKRNRENSFTAWREVTPHHNALVDALISSRIHIIATMRTKTEYVVEKDERGKSVPRKIGMQPVQRDGLEYEFDVVADLDQSNNLIIGKTRCSALLGKVFSKAGREVAETLIAWLSDGEAVEESKPAPQFTGPRALEHTAAFQLQATSGTDGEESESLEKDIREARDILGRTDAQLNDYVKKKYAHEGDWTGLPLKEKRELLAFLKRKVDEAANSQAATSTAALK